MKTNFLRKGFIYPLLFSFTTLSIAQDTARVSAYFIGSHGYLLESSKAKVALDALIYWEGDNYGYIKPPLAVAEEMEAAAPPFDSLDLILIGHAHNDHYNTEIVERSMLKNEDAVLVTTPGVLDDIEASVDSLSFYSDRIWVPELELFQSADTIIHDIPLTITCIPHGNYNMELYVPAIELDSIRFVQLNGWNSLTTQEYDTLGFNKEQADVIFLCYSYLLDNSKFELFSEHIHPVFSTISHVDGASSTRLNQIQDSIMEKREEYPMNMLYIPMEQLLYKKIDDTIFVDTLNNAPVQIASIPGVIEVEVNENFTLTLPEDLFMDIEGEPVELTVTSYSGGNLPAWMSYNPSTRILEGTPLSSGNTNIKINGADSHLAIRSITIRISVSQPEGLLPICDSRPQVYPSPASESIILQFGGTRANYNILDMTGKTILQGTIDNRGTIDISALRSGVYMIRLIVDQQIFLSKVLVQ